MSTPKICRICLDTEIKSFNYSRYELKNYYEQIMNTRINDKDRLPTHFCYMCATMLFKFHKFKEKCSNGQKILKALSRKGPITIKSVSSVDRHAEQLKSPLDVINVNHDRSSVRTFIIKSKQIPKVHGAVAPQNIDIDSDSSAGDDDLVEVYEKVGSSLDLDVKTENEEENNCQDNIKVNDVKVDTIDKTITPEFTDISRSDYETWSDKEIVSNEPEKESHKNKNNVSHNFSSLDNAERLSDDNKVFDNVDHGTERFDDLSEDEKLHTHDGNHSHEGNATKKEPDKILEKTNRNVKKRNEKKVLEIEKKRKKFEITHKKNTSLDHNNWLKYNLSEEEAVEEFKARAQHKRYIAAKYKCNDCLKGFSKEDMLVRHAKLRHSETAGPIECRFCRMRFKQKCSLTVHMRERYTKYQCLRCDLVCPLEFTALMHEEYHNGVTRKCPHCDQEFKHMTTYYTHLRTHRSEHVCTLCGASFVSAIGLRIHKKIKHVEAESTVPKINDEKSEYCSRCDIKFETKKAYEEHFLHSAKHVDGLEDLEVEAPITSHARKHRRKPIAAKCIPTDCHICGKHFATQVACRKHHLAEHPGASLFAPNERQICEICGMSLAPGSYATHINTHTRAILYSCNTCGKEFTSKTGLNNHQLIHSSEKPAACSLCDKRFKQRGSMWLHYRTFHLKEPYPKRNRKKKTDEISKLDQYPEEPH